MPVLCPQGMSIRGARYKFLSRKHPYLPRAQDFVIGAPVLMERTMREREIYRLVAEGTEVGEAVADTLIDLEALLMSHPILESDKVRHISEGGLEGALEPWMISLLEGRASDGTIPTSRHEKATGFVRNRRK